MNNENVISSNNTQNENESEKLQDDIQPIIDAIQNLENPKKSVWKNLLYFLISVVLFISLGLFYNPIVDLAILVGVIFFHELGHYIAMTSFGYKDVKMFFIPLFGAAVSGKPENISGAKKAIVTLAGPIPGIALGFFLGFFAGAAENYLVMQISIMLLFINGFNLLPIYPFDGGRFLFDVILSRQKYVEAIFKVLTVGILVGIAIYLQDLFFGFIAFIVTATIRPGFLIGSIAEEFSERKELLSYNKLLELPRDYLATFISKIKKALPNLVGKKAYANYTIQLWDKLNNTPPSLGQSIGLLLIYFVALLIVIWPFIFIGVV